MWCYIQEALEGYQLNNQFTCVDHLKPLLIKKINTFYITKEDITVRSSACVDNYYKFIKLVKSIKNPSIQMEEFCEATKNFLNELFNLYEIIFKTPVEYNKHLNSLIELIKTYNNIYIEDSILSLQEREYLVDIKKVIGKVKAGLFEIYLNRSVRINNRIRALRTSVSARLHILNDITRIIPGDKLLPTILIANEIIYKSNIPLLMEDDVFTESYNLNLQNSINELYNRYSLKEFTDRKLFFKQVNQLHRETLELLYLLNHTKDLSKDYELHFL